MPEEGKVDWAAHAAKNIPANFTGSKRQYTALHAALLGGLIDEVTRSFSVQFADIVRTAMVLEADEKKPVVESDIKLRFNFEDIDIANFAGKMSTDEKRKHDTAIKFTKDIDPKQKTLPLSTEPEEKPMAKKTTAKKKVANKGQPKGKKIKPTPSTRKKEAETPAEK